jgi:hypothetical protein
MKTLARTQANRSNALESTGPRTPAGKAIVARNAIKHGLLSREVVLMMEDRAAFRALATGLREYLQPGTTTRNTPRHDTRQMRVCWRLRP